MFKLWSEKNNEANNLLSPKLGLRDWNNLTDEEKKKIWSYIDGWFEGDKKEKFRIFLSCHKLNDDHKYMAYAELFLKNPSDQSAHDDFKKIFLEQDQNVVLELLSCFCKVILFEREKENGRIYRSDYESEEKYIKIIAEWRHGEFDKFTERLNNVFEHFGINLFLTRSGFVEKQDSKITKDIYVPVLNFISSPKWENVNRELKDAFRAFQLKSEHGYSNCITHAVSAIQAYLQILVDGKIGSSTGIINYIKQAQEKDLIPNDKFSSEIFKNIDSILMRERGKTGDAHPKQEYANEKSARLILNLIMIFLQHCIQYK
jgi:hypothetical protein